MTKLAKASYTIPKADKDWVEKEAKDCDRSASSVIRLAIAAYRQCREAAAQKK